MANQYELPEDVTTLSDEELSTHITNVRRIARSLVASTVATPQTLPTLERLRDAIRTLEGEQSGRTAAAEAAAAAIDSLAAEILGEPEADAEDVSAAEVVAEDTTEPTPVPVEATEVKTADEVAASAVRRPRLDLSAVRARQSGNQFNISRYVEAEELSTIEITASVDVPGYRPGQAIELSDITEGVIRRANALKTANGGVALVANYKLPFPSEMIVKDASSAPEGSLATMRAADQRRLPDQVLTASGGWCAPSETVYSITDIACPDMLWDLPEVQIARGGLRFFRTPVLDVNALTWIHTEQDDIAGTTKPCFVIPCPAPIEVRAEAQGVCLQSGILTERYFPELVDWYVRNSMVAHEIRLKSSMYDRARTASTAVTTTVSFAAFSAVYGAVALQAADMIERYNLCEGTELEVVFPWFLRNLFMADIARQSGVRPQDLDPAVIEGAFNRLGVRVQFARGLAPDVPTDIGGPTPATDWPADISFLIYPSGNFQLGRGPEVNLGVIIDSTTVATNDQKIFSEEGVMLIDRLGLSRNVTVTVCPNGAVGPRSAAVCPIA